MYHTLAMFLGRIGVTGIAQVFQLLMEQAFEAGHMRAVAGETIAPGGRFVIHPLLERGAVMTHETVDGRYRLPRADSQEQRN
jgi:hypothetical protein